MNRFNSNRKNNEIPPFPGVGIPWEKSKSEVWENLLAKMEENPAPVSRRLVPGPVLYALAASLLILLAVGSFMRFYTVRTVAGEQLALELPDRSIVTVYEGSTIAWHPYWWKIKREVSFEGKGLFEVEKGEVFTVSSLKGSTSVLGTVFLVNTTETSYIVACESGRVKVVSHLANSEVILQPGQGAEMNTCGELEIKTKSFDSSLGNFTFTSEPFSSVLKEICQVYHVRITAQGTDELLYTGNFSREMNVEEVLHLVCKPFGLEVTRLSENEYNIGK